MICANSRIDTSHTRTGSGAAEYNSSRGFSQPATLRQGRYSEDIADRNIAHSDEADRAPAPLKIAKSGTSGVGLGSPVTTNGRLSREDERAGYSTEDQRRGSVSRKAVGTAALDNRRPLSSETARNGVPQSSPSSLQKPLPRAPAEDPFKAVTDGRSYLVEDAPEPPSLKGVVDLTNTEDTTVHERWAPGMSTYGSSCIIH